ncbi:glycoside hydrolase family 3 protein [Planotetraspora kaengkrachanensis]|uniref:Hydrolase n=1 Tax=Planotetraspora kaengkrachanensis TaxID=575193 RepID=A0A8J3PT65_9ACTN|nr:glycoside hydrolase family 3 protein [Planotetraspora kaengkrachanensis]GIG80449.1 hydrolase [Planotetraspora kaengkrachanensis]
MRTRSRELCRLAMTVLQPGFEGTDPPDWLRRALADGLGGAVLFTRNLADAAQTGELVAGMRAENPGVVVAVDEEGGAITRLEARTGSSWPGNLALGVADDVRATGRVARQIGRMLGAADITLDYAPVVDVNADPRNPVIGVRSFGSDPERVRRHTVAWIEGLQGAGVAACAKHFPGHGDTVTDSHLALPEVRASREVLERRDLPPFRAAIKAGVRAIMCGHLLVPTLDRSPVTMSRAVLTGLLRDELGFAGLAVTDAIEMRAVAALHTAEEITVRALAAGADAICVGVSSPGGESVYALRDAIVSAVREGRLPEGRLTEAAGRVLELARWYADQAPARAAAARDVDEGVGLKTATAALRVIGTPSRPVLKVAPLVVEMSAQPSQAVGRATPVSFGSAIAEIMPGTLLEEIGEGDDLPDLTDVRRPVVLVVRDATRHEWIQRALARALEVRPDAVVVETGVPGTPAGAVYLATHGNSTASARAAARLLTAIRPQDPA